MGVWVVRSTPFDSTASTAGFAWQIVNDGSVSVSYGTNDQFDDPGITIIRSLDHGETWASASVNPITDSGSSAPGPLCYSPSLDMFLVNGWDDVIGWLIATSTDQGDTWTQRFSSSGFTVPGNGASCWAEFLGLFVVLNWRTFGGNERILTSPNGTAWTTHATNPVKRSNSIAVSDSVGIIVAGSNDTVVGKALLYSTDGINWTAATNDLARFNNISVIWSDTWSAFFATDGTGIVKSPDGINWTTVSTNRGGSAIGELVDGAILSAGSPTVSGPSYYGSLSYDGGATWIDTLFSPWTTSGTVYSISNDGVTNMLGGASDTFEDGSSTVMTGSPFRIIPPPGRGGVGGVGGSPLWKYFVAALDGTGITDYSKLARDRVVEVVLNVPLSVRGGAPSDNPQVNLVYTDDGYDDPYLNEGTRLLWGFRRESYTSPYYTVRAATIIQLVQDSAAQDDAVTAFQGWDPWHYMFSRPVCNSDGDLPGPGGLSFTNTQASVIIGTLLKNTIDNHGHSYIDAGTSYSGTAFYDGTLETGAGMEIDINFPQGTTVGQAWQTITSMGVCDIVLEPIYDPADRQNYLVQLNVYAQAGSTHDEFVFAWDLPGRSLVGIDRQFDGSSRANEIKFYAGPGGNAQGGLTIPVQEDADAAAKYGEYWAMQAFPQTRVAAAVLSLAQQQLALRANGMETVTFRPAPERSPRPWQDYYLGDRVPVWASRNFRDLLGETLVGSTPETQYQRIYGWTTNISDDALETIDPLLVSPQDGAM